ncbi:hypothetical protein CY34DRAFT_12217 [Suillus luteus UH-Slu-Lm8-n1]|uniref:Uncharacterized protein n=1 Tax=Suillus luteus UH-Slu-Lm8-n1 TaxID=930992 RepID=A0A0D0BHJ9_9AGAM|nr:hypothetical protein CY34DRAFT_12217 [Suillus luteus UH-Slu-Lm8-n1]
MILAAFGYDITIIYGFDASTFKTVVTPFEGHTKRIIGLALSFDGALLASADEDNAIKLWASDSESDGFILSPDSRKLAYVTHTNVLPDSPRPEHATITEDNFRIRICNTPPDILAQTRTVVRKKQALSELLNSDATRRPAGCRRPPISIIPVLLSSSSGSLLPVHAPPPSSNDFLKSPPAAPADSQSQSFTKFEPFIPSDATWYNKAPSMRALLYQQQSNTDVIRDPAINSCEFIRPVTRYFSE